MQKFTDWPERLARFIDSRRYEPFAWGRNDCALFAADGILEMTGVDLAAELRGYTTSLAAMKRVRDAGGMEALALVAGLRPVSRGFAQRGFLTLAPSAHGDTFGLNAGNGYWCAPGETALVFRPIGEVKTVFEV
jgi:hypothetical protein